MEEEYGRRERAELKEATEQNEGTLSNDEGEEKEMDDKRGSQLVSYSNGEPLVSYIKMMRRKKEERWDIYAREGKRRKDCGGCTRRRNRTPQVHEVDEEGAEPTA